MNGASGIGWDENSPADTESMGLTDDRIRSVKTSLRQALDDEHSFPSAGGSNVGYHRLGSARPYVGTQSNVSSSGTIGRTMITSDTSRYFGVGSGGTSYIGGSNVLEVGSFPGTVPQRHYWAMEFGTGTTNSSGSVDVVIPNSGFSGVPYVVVTPRNISVSSVTLGSSNIPVLVVVPIDNDEFYVQAWGAFTGAALSGQPFFWQSIGTRVL